MNVALLSNSLANGLQSLDTVIFTDFKNFFKIVFVANLADSRGDRYFTITYSLFSFKDYQGVKQDNLNMYPEHAFC